MRKLKLVVRKFTKIDPVSPKKPNKRIRLGIEVPEKKFKHLSHLFVKDIGNWITKNQEGAAVIEIPQEYSQDQKSCRDYLIRIGVITNPPYILDDPDIGVFSSEPSESDTMFFTSYRDYNLVYVNVDLTQCTKVDDFEIDGTRVILPEKFETFLGLIEDPNHKIDQFINDHGLTLKSRSTSDGTINGFPLVVRQIGKTKKELEDEYRYRRMKFHLMPSTPVILKPELKYVYALVIPKKGNDHLKESFVNNPEDWFIDGFDPETQALITIPLEYINKMNIPGFIEKVDIQNNYK